MIEIHISTAHPSKTDGAHIKNRFLRFYEPLGVRAEEVRVELHEKLDMGLRADIKIVDPDCKGRPVDIKLQVKAAIKNLYEKLHPAGSAFVFMRDFD